MPAAGPRPATAARPYTPRSTMARTARRRWLLAARGDRSRNSPFAQQRHQAAMSHRLRRAPKIGCAPISNISNSNRCRRHHTRETMRVAHSLFRPIRIARMQPYALLTQACEQVRSRSAVACGGASICGKFNARVPRAKAGCTNFALRCWPVSQRGVSW
jgi:hypothetical protein